LTLTAYFSLRNFFPGRQYHLKEISVNQQEVQFTLRDTDIVDGDRVTLTLNGVTIVADLTLTGDGTIIPILLQQGENKVIVEALNEGTINPNTFELSITNVASGPSTQLSHGLRTGQSDGLIVDAP
jgi:hypothetical protein